VFSLSTKRTGFHVDIKKIRGDVAPIDKSVLGSTTLAFLKKIHHQKISLNKFGGSQSNMGVKRAIVI